MATLPEVAGFDTDIVIAAQPSKTWIIDKRQNRVVGMDSGLESVRQAVEIALNVERFRWQIYNTDFGSEVNELIGEDEPYIVSELPRMVEEALSVDNRVVSIDNWVFTRNEDSMTVSFAVHTVYGDLLEGVVINA